ncbi:hypothetical protein [Peribacillus simplex]|uniref:hypothetical protein n=1 Tax=Peribacillus simplex TaxID=1478 RepID=UPI003338DF91
MAESLLGNRNMNQIASVVKDIEAANIAFTKLLGIKKSEPFLTGDRLYRKSLLEVYQRNHNPNWLF